MTLKVAITSDTVKVSCLTPSMYRDVPAISSAVNPVPLAVKTCELVAASKALSSFVSSSDGVMYSKVVSISVWASSEVLKNTITS